MCGIAGIMCLKRKECPIRETEKILCKMTDLIAHRGPDGVGYTTLDNGHVFLGHRRLAIIDLSEQAKQPMQSIDGRYTVTYNGEIYNYLDLKQELQKLGHRFVSDSDTEVLLKVYEQWGILGLNKLNGIFAFAIWDDYLKKMIIARDRYGTKPLYYAKIGTQFVFASEYKAFLAHPQFSKMLDLNAVKEYFTFQNLFSRRTFFENVEMLEAGSYMVLDYESDAVPKSIRFWDYDFGDQEKLTNKAEYMEELDRLFKQAVKRQLVSDVEVGTYLSGGIDSGAITAIASRYIPDLKTFTCGFDLHSASGIEFSFDEREKAEYMSYKYKTEHYEMVLKAGDMERCMDKLVWHLEDPRVGQSYPNFYAAKLSSNFVKVVLAGTGGDELFGGYPWRYYRASGSQSFDQYIDNYYEYWQRLLKESEQERFFSPVYDRIRNYSTKDSFREVFDDAVSEGFSPEDTINYSLYLEAKTFLQGLLIVEDKLSMAHGLETRVPFLDNDLVDFAMKIPSKYKVIGGSVVSRINENDNGGKVDKYYRIHKDGKLILRDVMGKYLPEDISNGKKQGFSAPDASWFKGESLDYVNSVIADDNANIYQYLDKTEVRRMFQDHIQGKENRRLLIWSVLNFEKWLQMFLCSP